MQPYERYVPRTLGELWDLIAGLRGEAPTFKDELGYFPEHNIDNAFSALHASLDLLQKDLGEARHTEMKLLADKAKALFMADPEDKTGETDEGFKVLYQIEDLLAEARRARRT